MPLTHSKRAPIEEKIHGVLVEDPYRWLEDRSLPETQEWIYEQQRRCDRYFAGYPELGTIRGRVREYLDPETADQPLRLGSQYFYRQRAAGQEQGCIFVRDDVAGVRLLVDPSIHGPFASVAIHHVSDDGSLLAYEFKHGGSEQKAIHIREVSSGRMLADHVESGHTRGFSFTGDLRGFYYSQETAEELKHLTIRLHLFGSQTSDEVCFRVERTRGSRLLLIADGVHLGALHLRQDSGISIVDFWIADERAPTRWSLVFGSRKMPCLPILRYGRIFALSSCDPMKDTLAELGHDGHLIRTVIPRQDGIVRQVAIAGGRIVVKLLHQMRPTIQCWNLDGDSLGSLAAPTDGTISLIAAPSRTATSVFYTYESFTQPPTIFELRCDTGDTLPWFKRPIPSGMPYGLLRNAVYFSKDGTEIPITIVEPVTTGPQPASRPAILTGYGGFGTPMTPRFSVLVAAMLEVGTTFILAHIRGGGEFGRQWHDSGRRRCRQVAFDDFVAAAEWVCSERITTPDKLAIFGGSNSGLLVGAAITQRPELFRAALCVAPLLDMVRYEVFDQTGKCEQEYGTVADREDFAALYAYSPYHRVKRNTAYPSMLFVTGDKDGRCNPAHVRKMAARLQDGEMQRYPILVDYSEERGHSPVLPLQVRIDALTRRIAFLCRELKILPQREAQYETPCV